MARTKEGDLETDIELRRKLGIDKFDEEWDGVYHVTPAPNVEHQRVFGELFVFLTALTARRSGGRVLPEINVFRVGAKKTDYRIPDLVYVAPGHESFIARDGLRGTPDFLIEIRSPGDDTIKKIPFYGKIGTRELLVVHRDTKVVTLYSPVDALLRPIPNSPDGGVVSSVLDLRFRTRRSRLLIEDLRAPRFKTEI